jgi:hypothetical protein
MGLDLTGITPGQWTLILPLAAAATAGIFAFINALITTRSTRKQSRDASIRDYRLKASADLIELVRRRCNTVFALHLRVGVPMTIVGAVPPHKEMKTLFYAEGEDPHRPIALRMASPFTLRNMAMRFHGADMELYEHLKKPDEPNCVACQLLANHVGRVGYELYEMLERFVFKGTSRNRLYHWLRWKYIERRYDKMRQKHQVSKIWVQINSREPVIPNDQA